MRGPTALSARRSGENYRCYVIDPTQDLRWTRLVERHSQASVFHTIHWLRALSKTYKYKPVVYSTSPPEAELSNGVVFCQIDSWLTGRRLVSLPFSDHCEALCDSAADLSRVLQFLQAARSRQGWKHLQVRPLHGTFTQSYSAAGFLPSDEYHFHSLDLSPNLEDIFNGLNKSSVQRRIQRAERAGLLEKTGRSQELLLDFYTLFLLTRHRQRVPPTPYIWFENLTHEMGEALEIRAAYNGNTPVAAILTLQFRDTIYYKYGCSDTRFGNYGATPWLFWKAITSAKRKGAAKFDLGRTERDNPGLLAFKNHWAPDPKPLTYWRCPGSPANFSDTPRKWNLAKSVFARIPIRLQVKIGELLYPHVG